MLLRISIVITVVAAIFLLSADVQCEFNQSEFPGGLPESVYEENKLSARHDIDMLTNDTQIKDIDRKNVIGIYDGWNVESPQQFPYHAYIGCVGDPINDVAITSWKCNGAIINDRFVLTSATCVENCTLIKIRVGATVHPSMNSSAAPQEYFNKMGSKLYYVHPQHLPGYYDNDLALIETSDPIIFSQSVGQVILPDNGQTVISLNETIVATGFGQSYKYNVFWELQYLTLEILRWAECLFFFPNISVKTFCARGVEHGVGIENSTLERGRMCHEYGAPAVLKRDNRTLVGIYKRSFNCEDNSAEVFFAIEDYLSWIKEIAIDRLIT